MPLVAAHGVVTHLRRLRQRALVVALEEAIEPAEGDRVVVEPCIPQVALPDDGVLLSPLIAAMGNRRDDGVLLIGDLRAGGLAHVVVRGQIGRNTVVVPGHHPKAG